MIIGSKLLYRENLPSTNSHCTLLLKQRKVQEGTIIYTNYQTSGRGQMGNTWESESGKNLLFSIILYPLMLKPEKQFILSKTISLGICDFLERYLQNVFIKWPNDLYVGSDKIAGILLESSIIQNELKHVVAGIGLNVNQEKFTMRTPNPTSLKLLCGKDFELSESLSAISGDIDRRYKQLLHNKVSAIEKDYLSHLWRYGEWSMFKSPDGIFDGRILSVGDAGRLQIEDRRGRIYEFTFKDVDFL